MLIRNALSSIGKYFYVEYSLALKDLSENFNIFKKCKNNPC